MSELENEIRCDMCGNITYYNLDDIIIDAGRSVYKEYVICSKCHRELIIKEVKDND